ncbi:MAG: cytidylate kinase-like family protein [Clostridia bacterium]|nr:cytidylate kinase-like family protein [Lachnospiraceae bacterium]NCB99859.1 cytidylate kinase-like family protein [Clostridia bacterium]NCD02798.1 cytidylate kinase-like family protein [Clostridia bacterium]
MAEKKIICIGREYGSGGREIGEKLAEKLGIPCYDKVLLKQTAVDSGLAQSLFENADEKRTSWILNGFCSGNPTADAAMMTSMDYLTNDSLFFMQSRTIQKLAAEGSCVFIGRCAESILENTEGMISIFIHGDKEDRIERIMKRQNIDRKRAESLMNKIDKRRASYHNYYSDVKWGRSDSYHMSISSSRFGIDGTVEMIASAIKFI